MKKIILSFLVFILCLSVVTPVFGQEHGSNSTPSSEEDVLNVVEGYVQLQEDGTIAFENVPNDLYQDLDLGQLEVHFDTINSAVLNGDLIIDEDLNITETGFSTMDHAVYGEWRYHWWGYQRNFTNAQAQEYRNRLLTQAAGAGMVTGVGAWFPPVAGIAGVSGGYWALLATRVDANNNGNGVRVSVTWANIFSVTSL